MTETAFSKQAIAAFLGVELPVSSHMDTLEGGGTVVRKLYATDGGYRAEAVVYDRFEAPRKVQGAGENQRTAIFNCTKELAKLLNGGSEADGEG